MTPDQERKLDETRDSTLRTEGDVKGLLRSYTDLDGRVSRLERRDDQESNRVIAEARKSHADAEAGERSKLATYAARRWDIAKVVIGGIAAAVLGWVTSHANTWGAAAWRWLREKGN